MIIPTSDNTRTISDLREKTIELLKQLSSTYGPLYIFYRSRPSAVMLNIGEYQKLLEIAEDYFDALKAEEYEKEDKTRIKWLSHEELIKKLS